MLGPYQENHLGSRCFKRCPFIWDREHILHENQLVVPLSDQVTGPPKSLQLAPISFFSLSLFVTWFLAGFPALLRSLEGRHVPYYDQRPYKLPKFVTPCSDLSVNKMHSYRPRSRKSQHFGWWMKQCFPLWPPFIVVSFLCVRLCAFLPPPPFFPPCVSCRCEFSFFFFVPFLCLLLSPKIVWCC